MTGYTADEIDELPRKGLSLVIEDDLDRVKKEVYESLNDQSKDIFNINYRIVGKDKEIIWINEHSTILRNSDGNVKEIYGILNDVTGLKNKENELAAKLDEKKQADLIKDRFISILSHDLRAPFTSILGFCDILIREPDLTKAEMMEYLNFIYASSQIQLQLINYLLDWSRLQTGELKVEPFRLNVQATIYDNVSSLTGMAVRKNIEIKVNADISLYIKADEKLLEQVLNNLISNSIKFSREGNLVEIYAGTFNDEFIEFVIKDEGVGIPEINKKKLFQIDKMFSSAGTKGEKGTGLGLALSKLIIEQHGGKLWYYSETGKGTEFHFTLPSAVSTILIIDDDQQELGYFMEIAQESYPGYQIIGTGNSFHAIEVITQKSPSLIITNHDMPLMNSLQMIQLIKKQDDSFKTPVIAFSGLFPERLKDTYIKYGINNFIQKPVDKEILTQSMHSLLN